MSNVLNRIAIIGLLGVSGFLFFESWASLFIRWLKFDESYSHGVLVFAISLYYFFEVARREIEWNVTKPNYFFALPLIGACLLWALAIQANIQILHQLLLPVILFTSITFTWGAKQSQKLLFPIFFLYMAIPWWDYLTEPLQALTVHINMILLGWIQIPAYIDGFFVTIPAGSFEVAGGCSGLRYLIVAIALSTLYSYQNLIGVRSTIKLLGVAVALSLVTNWTRVVTIIVIGQLSDMQSPLIAQHELFGWILFAFALIPFFWVASNLPGTQRLSKLNRNHEISDHGLKVTAIPYAVMVLLMSVPVIAILMADGRANLVPIDLGELNSARIETDNLILSPKFTGADISRDKILKLDDRTTQISIRIYEDQKHGKELVAYSNRVFSRKWGVVENEETNGFKSQLLRNRSSGQQLRLLTRYTVGGISTASRKIAKLLELIKPLMASKYSSILIIATSCEGPCESAQNILDYHFENHPGLLEKF